jgi:hypothetical protein
MTDTNGLLSNRLTWHRHAAKAAAFFFCFALHSRGEGRLTAAGLGEPVFADRETSATFALPQAAEKNWRLTLSLAGTPSNSVEIAFGRDSNTNAVLDAEETAAAVGWDRGVWFASGGPGLEERFTAAPSGCALTLDVRFAVNGAVKQAAFSEGKSPLPFEGMPAAPAWLDPAGWDTLRLTARGAGVRAEAARVSVFPDGTSVTLK